MLAWCLQCLVLLWRHCQGIWQANRQQQQQSVGLTLTLLIARRVLLGALLLVVVVVVEVLLLLLRWRSCCLGWQRLRPAAAAGRNMGSGCCWQWRVLHCLMVSHKAGVYLCIYVSMFAWHLSRHHTPASRMPVFICPMLPAVARGLRGSVSMLSLVIWLP
jgi:hypothetical protein